jgi:hypothetical protein
MYDALPNNAIVFPGPDISTNLVDEANKLGM